MKIKPYLFKLFILLSGILSVTQTYGQISQAPSPNVASFAIFDQYPQTSFTGVPSIDVPVYNFEYNGFSLPIALRYNNNLVRPFTSEGWVGLGWNLSVGGMVSRVVNGKPDDRNWFATDEYIATQKTAVGYFYNYGYMSASDWASPSRLADAITDETNMTVKDMYGATVPKPLPSIMTINDYAPDEFSFSVGDLSGTFYLDHQKNWKVRSKKHVQIIVSDADFATRSARSGIYTNLGLTFPDYRYLSRITIKDDRGITHVFGGVDNALEWTVNDNEDRDDYIKSWNLVSINFPNGKTINYTYEHVNLSQLIPIGYTKLGNSYNYLDEYYSASFLTNIHTDLQNIDFTRVASSANVPKLTGIKVTNIANNQVVFNSQFIYTNSSDNRLNLYSFAQIDRNNKVGPQYFFRYNVEHFTNQINNTDHWGYYTSVPFNYNNYWHLEGGCRSADTAGCRAELLDRIINPEGGSTVYTWEPNTYSKIFKQDGLTVQDLGYNASTGGARIKQITNFDQNGNRVGAKRYVYNRGYSSTSPNGLSSGVLHGTPIYIEVTSGHVEMSTNMPLSDLNTGSHITYSETAEINEDGSYSTTLYSNYDTFDNTSGEYMDAAADGYTSGSNVNWLDTKVSSNGHERGFPLRERIYSNTGLLKQKVYSYTRVDKDNNWVRAYLTNMYDARIENGLQFYYYTGYAVRFYTNAYLPQSITETTYNQANQEQVSTVTAFQYDPVTLNPITVTRTDSKGQTLKTQYRYVTDLLSGLSVPTNVSPVSFPYSFMLNNNMTSIPIETVHSIIKGGTEQITSATLTKYQGLTGTLSYVTPTTDYQEQVNGVKQAAAFTHYAISIDGSGEHETAVDTDLKPVLNYSKWDNGTGNLLQFSKNSESPVAVKWGYQNTLKIAACKNATSDEFFYEGFEDQPSTYARLEQYGGHTGQNCITAFYPVNWTPPVGDTRIFYITYWYRNAGVWYYQPKQVYTGSITLSGYDAYDDIRIYPAGAQMTTYTYIPSVGISSITDAKNMTTYYEYDNLNRLRMIKDGKRNILKAYCYNYKGEVSNCLVPQANPWPSIYAKIVMSDQGTSNTPDSDGSGYIYEQRATFTVKFYSDEACTIPYTLPADMYIYVVDTYQTFDEVNGITNSVDYTNVLLASAGQNSMMIGTQSMPYADTHFYTDSFGNPTYDGVQNIYKLVPNVTNTYVIK